MSKRDFDSLSEGEHWTTKPDGYLEPKVSTGNGVGAYPAETIITKFYQCVEKYGSRNCLALKRPVNGKVPDDWKFTTWAQYATDCQRFARALIKHDVALYRIVNVIGFNSPEWLMANMGAILAGCIAAGIYTTNTPPACEYISEHSQAEVVVCEGNVQLKKYKDISANLPHLKAIVVWGSEPLDPVIKSAIEAHGKKVYTWDGFLETADMLADLDARAANIKPGNCSTLIYTSGTTGNPKAVMISHDNVTWTTRVMCEKYMDLGPDDRIISYLPLSHIAAQIFDIHVPILVGACVYFAQPDALKGSLVTSLNQIEPTLFFGVPRVWEKIQEKMMAAGRSLGAVTMAISGYAKSKGIEKTKCFQYGGNKSHPFLFQCLQQKILSKVREKIGLSKCRACFTAAAPISPDTLWYFASLDIPIYEVFGQSECTGPHTISVAEQWKIGYCGRPMKGTESMLVPENGELCYRGRHIFMGYMYMPDKTRETIDPEGWLHSGDVSEFDDDNDPDVPKPAGFMRITGRIKELIITAGGENVPPVLIENEMKSEMLAISNCMVVGDRRKYLAMLVSLKCEVDPETGESTEALAADSLFEGGKIGSTAKTLSDAAADPLWKKYIDEGVSRANKKTTSNAQVVQKWVMMPTDFSEKAGDLTPTMKLKRNVVSDKYVDLIDSIYGESVN
jgi:long-chain-fatty-acid--CoA ligase ACSBG